MESKQEFSLEENRWKISCSSVKTRVWVYSNASYTPPNYSTFSATLLTNLNPNQWYIITLCARGDCTYLVFLTDGNCAPRNDKFIITDGNNKNLQQDAGLNGMRQMIIHPNPSTRNATVTFDEVTTGKLTILAIEGKVIYAEEFSDKRSIDLNLSNYPSGMYVVEVSSEIMKMTERLLKK